MVDFITETVKQSQHDPFFWMCHVVIVAMTSYVVYNLWTRQDDDD